MPSNKKIVIAGGASGLGLACGSHFLAKNYNVVVIDKKSPPVQWMSDPRIEYVECDVSKLGEIDQAMLKAAHCHETETIDVFLCTVGAFVFKPLWETTRAYRWMDACIGNLVAPAMLTAQATSYMPKGSHVILIGSAHDDVAKENYVTYSATKMALRSVVTCGFIDNGKNISFHLFRPHQISTKQFLDNNCNGSHTEFYKKYPKGLSPEQAARIIYSYMNPFGPVLNIKEI